MKSKKNSMCGLSNGTKDSLSNGTKDSLSNGTKDSLSNGTNDCRSNEPKSSLSNGTKDSLSNGTKDNLSNGTKDSLSNGTKDSLSNGVKDSLPNGTKGSLSYGTKDSLSNGTKDSLSHGTKDNLSNGMKDTLSNGTKDSVSNGTMDILSKTKDALSNGTKGCPHNGIKDAGDDESFQSFAEKNFLEGHSSHFSRKDLKHPLLAATPDTERQATLAIWKVILRFMGDMPDYRATPTTTTEPTVDTNKDRVADVKRQMTRGGTMRRLKATLMRRLVKEEEQEVLDLLPLEESLQTPLEQLHFIIGYGILKPALRDEIYCQTCKQLTKNPYKWSVARGWLLMSLLVGCFAPSDDILKYVVRYLEDGPPLYTVTCKRNLQRTLKNGARFQPPAFIELEAGLNKRLLDVSVTLMDGTMHTMQLDAGTTSHELCTKLAEFIALRDQFGFSIYIAMYNKVASLGNGNDHILDSISQCEQIYRETENKEGPAPWRLFYRKEIFSPWENASNDWVATGLVFSQVVRGIMLGEYKCESDQQLAVLAAQQYYIEYGSDISEEGLIALLPSYIPQAKIQSDDAKRMWRRAVFKAHKKLFDMSDSIRMPQEKVKQEVVNMAKYRWPMAFSRYYDVTKLEGPNWPNDNLCIGVNCKGLAVLVNGFNICDISFSDIVEVSDGGGHGSGPSDLMVLILASGAAIKLSSADGDDMRHLVTFMLNGLKQRSTYAVIVQKCEGDEDGHLAAEAGDLVVLGRQAGLEALTSETCVGRNERTGAAGSVCTAHIYVLPTLVMPTDDTLKMFRSRTHSGKRSSNENTSVV